VLRDGSLLSHPRAGAIQLAHVTSHKYTIPRAPTAQKDVITLFMFAHLIFLFKEIFIFMSHVMWRFTETLDEMCTKSYYHQIKAIIIKCIAFFFSLNIFLKCVHKCCTILDELRITFFFGLK